MGHGEDHQSAKFYAGLVEEIIDYAKLELDIAFGHLVAQQPQLPLDQRRVWRYFWDMNEGRQSHHDLIPENKDGQFGWRTKRRVDRLSHTEMLAFLELSGLDLAPWEMATLQLLDEVYVRAFNAAGDPNRERVSSVEFTPQLFEALFRKK